ncbi:PREDICTED: uncharacterized protein LOC107073515 [Polistes dominula]|uniref:Uncharacterized protein LOC107073515 n=1 Tax=Polistes dominula TaxID=743375 RepID=A0ABM1JB54_POLDO|nr:PREDICTED: uncharacterized protein LOC107073515 [Polistes dominula]
MTNEELLYEIRKMFRHLPSCVDRKREFMRRQWKHGERFSEYFHDKVILGNCASVSEEELIEYLIDGIPDTTLQNTARIRGFRDRSELFSAFEKIQLPTGPEANRARRRPEEVEGESTWRRPMEMVGQQRPGGQQRIFDSCHNCGERGHRAAFCPSREKGTRCYSCQGFGHISAGCPKRAPSVTMVRVGEDSSADKQYVKKVVTINNAEIPALIDTGSQITLIRESAYADIGAPRIINERVSFRGVGSELFKTLGHFTATIEVDGETYDTKIHLVSDSCVRHDLVLGENFLKGVRLVVDSGDIEVGRSSKTQPTDGDLPNVYNVNVCDSEGRVGQSYLEASKVEESVVSSVAVRTTGKTAMTDISKDEVRREVTAILKDADFITMLTEKVRQRIEKKLDVDLTARKEEVDDLVIQCLQKNQDGERERNKAASEGSDDGEDEEKEDAEEEEREEEKKPARRSPTKKTSSKRKEDSSASKKSASNNDIDKYWDENRKAPGSGDKKGGAKDKGGGYTSAITLSPEVVVRDKNRQNVAKLPLRSTKWVKALKNKTVGSLSSNFRFSRVNI